MLLLNVFLVLGCECVCISLYSLGQGFKALGNATPRSCVVIAQLYTFVIMFNYKSINVLNDRGVKVASGYSG